MSTTPDKAAIGDGNQGLGASYGPGSREPSREGVSAVPASIPSRMILDEICAHLGAARIQLIPKDDAIIAEHIRAAHDLSLMLRRAPR